MTITMKNYIIFLFTVSVFFCNAQKGTEFDYNNFENQFLSYESTKSSQVSKKNFDYANMIINETKSATQNNSQNFNVSDYFNILSAFLTLNESEKNIKIAYTKFKDADGSCEYVLSFEKDIEENSKYDKIRADYLEKLKECKQNSIPKKKFNIEVYCKSNNLDMALVTKINKVKIDDQKHRNDSSKELRSKQLELDKRQINTKISTIKRKLKKLHPKNCKILQKTVEISA